MEKEHLILADPMVEPNNDILEKSLGKKYNIYGDFVSKINEIGLVLEWNYYREPLKTLAKK